MLLVLLGPPGSGKGSQSERLVDEFGMQQVSTGEMLRAEVRAGSEIGQQVATLMDEGKQAPDELMVRILEQRLAKIPGETGIILDGFPRTLNQAQKLDEMLPRLGRRVDAAIEMQLPEAVSVGRITGRFACAKCGAGYHEQFKPTAKPGVCDVCGSTEFTRRSDDSETVVTSRLDAYRRQTAPVIPHYRDAGVLLPVDADRGFEAVYADIRAIVQGL